MNYVTATPPASAPAAAPRAYIFGPAPVNALTPAPRLTIPLSNSRLSTIASCPRRYQLSSLFAQPFGTRDSGLAAVSGTAIHAYLQTMLATNDIDLATYAFFKSWDFNIEQAEYDKSYISDAVTSRNLTASYHTARAIWPRIAGERDNLVSLLPPGAAHAIPACETRFSIAITAPSLNLHHSYYYEGTIDIALHDTLRPERYRLIDIKTHREAEPERLEARYRYAAQLIPYAIAIQACTGQPITSLSTEYWAIYPDQLAPDLHVFHYERTASDILAWLHELRRQIITIDAYASDAVWPRTQHGCTFYNRTCRFFNSVCHIANATQTQAAILGYHPPLPPVNFDPHINLVINLDNYLEPVHVAR